MLRVYDGHNEGFESVCVCVRASLVSVYVLYEENERDYDYNIATSFVSRTFTKSELNYTLSEKETFSVVSVVNTFTAYKYFLKVKLL